MLQIDALTLGDYQTNTYIVHSRTSKTCCIIDPGYQADAILKQVAALGLTVDAILLTHGHFDHVGAVEEIVEKTGCALWMAEADWRKPIDPMTTYFYPLANCDFTDVQFCREGQIIAAGGLKFQVIETPGHTQGSVCYLCNGVLFSGDTLFAGSCGRTDLPGGDARALRASLNHLADSLEDCVVCPGHGTSTTLAKESSTNPFMR